MTRSKAAFESVMKEGTFSFPLPSAYVSCISSHNSSSPLHFIPSIPCSLYSTPPFYSTTDPSFPSITSSPPTSSVDGSEPSHSYNLHPQSHHVEASLSATGLGLSTPRPSTKSSRDRKYFLSKAIIRAGAEIVSGRQSSIDRVLRGMNTQACIPS